LNPVGFKAEIEIGQVAEGDDTFEDQVDPDNLPGDTPPEDAMIGRLAVAGLLVAAPAVAQTRVYTNADLGKPLSWEHTPTPEELASLKARQFVPMPFIPERPSVRVIEGDPAQGPFGPLELSAYTQPLDPNWYGNSWGYWGPGLVNPYPIGKRGFGFGRGFGSSRGFGSVGGEFRHHMRPSGTPGPGRGVAPPPGPSSPAPASGGGTRLAGNAAAIRRPARP